MKRKRFLSLVLLGLIGVTSGTIVGATPNAAPSSEKSQSAPLAISIAVPERNGERRIDLNGDNPGFDVVIQNISDKPQKIWQD